jgi:hypothetical protein
MFAKNLTLSSQVHHGVSHTYIGMPTSDPKIKGLQTKRRIIEQFVMLYSTTA